MQHEIKHVNEKELREFGIVTGAIVAGLFGLFIPWLLEAKMPLWPWILAGVLGTYTLAIASAGISTAVRLRRAEYVLTLPAVMALLHATYGLGSWWGGIRLLRARLVPAIAAGAFPGPAVAHQDEEESSGVSRTLDTPSTMAPSSGAPDHRAGAARPKSTDPPH